MKKAKKDKVVKSKQSVADKVIKMSLDARSSGQSIEQLNKQLLEKTLNSTYPDLFPLMDELCVNFIIDPTELTIYGSTEKSWRIFYISCVGIIVEKRIINTTHRHIENGPGRTRTIFDLYEFIISEYNYIKKG